ncbi:unnamed protein product [Rhizoctonia solani]|uniref:RGS domain-containing protein n=1 Tax=Rhizoctonia solani TaxID=456999 RepID=A0A8H3C6H8_9AGAM|nr:unnamed protein product [Rhizoctonia solani]
MYTMGLMSRGRGYVAGSLPIIWFGIWFMLVSINGHCLVVYVTGDARQLYPHEIARPLPADTNAPPMYSLALAPNEDESAYSFGRKTSTTSNLLPLVHTPTLSMPRPSYHPLANLSTRRGSEPMTKVPPQWERQGQDKIPPLAAQDCHLPPARRTKNLPRSSLTIDVGLDPRVAVVDYATRHQAVVEWPDEEEEEEMVESPELTEENDFGIVISEAYEEDEPGPFLFPAYAEDRPAPANSFAGHNEEPIQPHFISGPSPEPLAPLVQAPEYAAQRRRTVLDLFASEPPSGSRRGSKASTEVDQRPGPGDFDIPLSDFSGHLDSGLGADGPEGDVPEWERMELPFNLPVIAPSVNNEQPTTWSLSPTSIKGFPTRLKNAPPRPRGVPLRKKFTVVPEYDIPLTEILDDLHASPLSLREFEEYLLYVERTVENLYFCLWLRQYTQTYRDWERRHPQPSDTNFESPSTSTFRRPADRSRTRSVNVPLANSFQRAKRLFFDASSQYELNVTEDMIDPIREWVKPPKKRATGSKKPRRVEAWEEIPEPEPERDSEMQELLLVHPHPDSFQRVLTEIEGTLRQSLIRFFQLSFTNSGRSHDKLGYSVWFVYIMASVAASVSIIINHRPRALRLVVTPMLLLGWTVGLSTYNGICPAIFAFGDARQLYPYEIFVLKCRLFVQNPCENARIDWKHMGGGGSSKNVTSADPIIRPKRSYRPRRPSRFSAVRRVLAARGRRKQLPPQPDLESGRQIRAGGGGFGFRVEGEPDHDRSFGNLHETLTLEPETPMPPSPPAAYIPTKESTISVHRLAEQMHRHPWTPTAAAYGGFDIHALRPQPVSRRRYRPHIPHRASNHSNTSPQSCETEVEIPDQDELAREFGLDLGDPRALGLYGHMVTVPNPIVRHVHREIFVRAWWMAVVVTIPILVILLVIP